MAVSAPVAGLLTGLFWGLAPVVAKRGFGHGGNPMLGATIFITTGVVVFWGAVAATQGLASLPPALSPTTYAIFVVGGIFGTVVGRISSFEGLDRVGASVNTAVLAVNPLIATGLAFVFLGESINAIQVVGIVVTVVGLVVLSSARGGDISGWHRRDLLFPLLAATAFAFGHVVRRYGLTVTGASAIEGAAINETAAFVTLGAFLLARRRDAFEPLPARGWVIFVVAGIISALGLLMLFVGLQVGRVAIVATLAGTATLFATLFTYLFLEGVERITPRVLVGGVLVVAGASIITLF